MNLNFIQDSDKIHVETQNQIAYKQQIILKMKLLKQDFKDYTEINHGFVQINNVFSEIVKQLYEHVTNYNKKQSQRIMMDMNADNIVSVNGQGEKKNCEKKKKKVSIPYGTIKKLQLLRQKMISCKIIIQNQNKFYRAKNFNRQNQKISEVRFYKKVLQSYQNERQYFKKQTLDLQDRVQQIQAEVKKLSYNENHEFTDFDSKIISFEAIMKYQKKMIALKKLITELNLFTQLKTKINNELNFSKKKEDSKINESKQQIKISYGSKFMKSSFDLQKKINLLKRQKIEILQHSYLKYKNLQYQAKVLNQKLKKALLQYQAQKYVLTLQNKIQNKRNDKQNMANVKLQKITKTDYMIYLKEISSQLKEYFKSKQIVYRFKDTIHKNRIQQRSKSANFQQ